MVMAMVVMIVTRLPRLPHASGMATTTRATATRRKFRYVVMLNVVAPGKGGETVGGGNREFAIRKNS